VVAQFKVFPHHGPAEVEVTVFHAKLFTAIVLSSMVNGGILDVFRISNESTRISIWPVGILVFLLERSATFPMRDHKFPAQFFSFCKQVSLTLDIENELSDSITVAKIDKRHSPFRGSVESSHKVSPAARQTHVQFPQYVFEALFVTVYCIQM